MHESALEYDVFEVQEWCLTKRNPIVVMTKNAIMEQTSELVYHRVYYFV